MKTIFLLSAVLCLTTGLFAQQPAIPFKKNDAPPTAKQDQQNIYGAEGVSTLDLMEMLDLAGIRLFKFPMEGLDRETSLWLTIDEYRKGERVSSDTIRHFKTTYVYYEGENPYKDYIDGIRLSMRQEPGKLTYRIATPGMSMTGRPLEYTPDAQVLTSSPACLYHWRCYHPQAVQYGKKTPLLVLASPWYDERIHAVRFCGVSQLTEGEAASEELLAASPHYFLFSYVIH